MQHLPKDTQIKRTVSMFFQKELDQRTKSDLQRGQISSRYWNRERIDHRFMSATVVAGK